MVTKGFRVILSDARLRGVGLTKQWYCLGLFLQCWKQPTSLQKYLWMVCVNHNYFILLKIVVKPHLVMQRGYFWLCSPGVLLMMLRGLICDARHWTRICHVLGKCPTCCTISCNQMPYSYAMTPGPIHCFLWMFNSFKNILFPLCLNKCSLHFHF